MASGSLNPLTDFHVQLPLIVDITSQTAATISQYVEQGIPVILFVKKIGRKTGGGGPIGLLKNTIDQVNSVLIESVF